MNTDLKTIFPAVMLGLAGTAHASPVNVDVQVTADNAYAIYTGNETDIYEFHGTAENDLAAHIASPESYSFSMDDGDIIYIAAWSDDATAQGLLAEFNIDGTILTTGNSQWEVMATGIDLDPGDPAPTLSELTTAIGHANAGTVPSGGWVNTTLGGPNDPSWLSPGSVYVPSMASTLQWAWYHQPGYTGDTFLGGYNHDEYLVFRLEFPIGGCCIEDACFNLTPDDCELAGGLYNDLLCEDTDWTCPEDPETGACCVETDTGNVCMDVSESECIEHSGDWFGLGLYCVDVLAECEDPPPETGACCVETADGPGCMDVTEAECEAYDGDWWGLGVNCADVLDECMDPEPEAGACCVERPDGPQCIETTKDICKESDGIWYGWGTVCVDVIEECLVEDEPVYGACCAKDECIDTTEEDCEAMAGDFQGEGSTCLDAAVTCDEEPSSTDDGKPASSCSVTGAGGTQGIGLLLVSLLGLVRRRR